MALNRQLKFTSTLAVSVAMMAPSLAISLNPQVMVGDVGAAIPVAFLVAAITVPLLGWCFATLARRDGGQAGSVYRYVGSTLGERLGFDLAPLAVDRVQRLRQLHRRFACRDLHDCGGNRRCRS